MKKSIIFLLTLLLLSSVSYSQKIILIDSDTSICFNNKQSKYLLTSLYKLQECQELSILKSNEITNLESIISFKDNQYKNSQEMFWNCDSIQKITYDRLSVSNNNLKKSEKKLKRSKKIMVTQLGVIVIETIIIAFLLK